MSNDTKRSASVVSLDEIRREAARADNRRRERALETVDAFMNAPAAVRAAVHAMQEHRDAFGLWLLDVTDTNGDPTEAALAVYAEQWAADERFVLVVDEFFDGRASGDAVRAAATALRRRYVALRARATDLGQDGGPTR